MRRIARFLRDEDATTAHEYAVIVALIMLALLGGASAMSTRHTTLWGEMIALLKSVGFLN